MPKHIFKFKSNYTIGHIEAELDKLNIENCFYEHPVYLTLKDFNDKRCFLIGRTGTGKSAFLSKLEQSEDNIIRIIPDSFSFNYIVNDIILRSLEEANVHLEPFFTLLWKHVMTVEILKYRYDIKSSEEKPNIIAKLFGMVKKDEKRERAVRYIDTWGEKLWSDTSEGIREFTSRFKVQLGANVNLPGIGIEPTVGIEKEKIESKRNEIQKAISTLPSTDLNEMINIINEFILDDEEKRYYVIIDDLDTGWVDTSYCNVLIRCLFACVHELIKSITNIKFVIALRKNIFDQLQYSNVGRMQEEKFRSLVININWSDRQIENVVDSRLKYLTKINNRGFELGVKELISGKSNTFDPMEYIIGNTQRRPRDIIKYINLCINNADNKQIIDRKIITEVEESYSNEAFRTILDEWKDPYSDLGKVLIKFENATNVLSCDKIVSIIDNIEKLISDYYFKGGEWLTALLGTQKRLMYDKYEDRKYEKMIRLLYEIGFIGIKENKHAPITYVYDMKDPKKYFDFEGDVKYYIHKSYHHALSTRTLIA